MGWISKMIKAATNLEETPNVANRVLDTAENFNNSVDRAMDIADDFKKTMEKISKKISERNCKNAIASIDKMQGALSRLEEKWDKQYNQSIGKSNEEKIQITDEHKAKVEYIIACKYNDIHYAGSNMYVVKLYDKYGVITTEEKIVIPIEYDYIVDYSEEKFCACKNGKWGFIDINNNVVIDFLYEDADSFSTGVAPVSKIIDGKELYGYIDSSANVIIPYKYDFARCFEKKGIACVGMLDTWGDIRKGVITKDDVTVVNCHYAIIEIYDTYIMYCLESHQNPKFFDLKGMPVEMEEPKEEVPKNIIIPYWDSEMRYGYYVHSDDGDYCKVEPMFEKTYSLNKEGYGIIKKDGLYGIVKIG